MSVTKIWAIHSSKSGNAISASVKYIKRENEKLDLSLINSTDYVARIDENYEIKPNFISAVGCDLEDITSKFLADEIIYKNRKGKSLSNGKGGKEILAYHVVQSFPTHSIDINEEEVHQMGLELLASITGNNFAGIVVTHNDTNNLHNHIIFNAYPDCNYDAQTKFKTIAGKGENATFSQVRRMNDKILFEHGYEVIEPSINTSSRHNKKKLWQEKNSDINTEITIRNYIYSTINNLKENVETYEELKLAAKEYGILILDEANRKHTRYFVEGISERPIRARSISETLQKENLEEFFKRDFKKVKIKNTELEIGKWKKSKITFNEMEMIRTYKVNFSLSQLFGVKKKEFRPFKEKLTQREKINERYILDFMKITNNNENYDKVREKLNSDLKIIRDKKYKQEIK